MVEEVIVKEPDAVEETVVVQEEVTQEVVDKVNEEVAAVEDSKISDAKAEGAMNAVDQLKAELAELRAKNEEVLAKQVQDAEAAKLRAEIDAEKAKMEQPVKKHIVPPAENPNKPPVQEVVQAPKLTREQEWAEFDKGFRGVSVNNDNQ